MFHQKKKSIKKRMTNVAIKKAKTKSNKKERLRNKKELSEMIKKDKKIKIKKR